MDGHGGVIVIDQVIQITAFALILGLPGALFVVYGAMLIVNRPRGLPWGGNRLRFAYELAGWYEKGTFQTEEQFEEIRLQLRSIAGWSMVGGGLAWLLSAGGLILGMLALPNEERGFFMTVPIVPLLLLQGPARGYFAGHVFGSARAIRKAPHAPTCVDPRPRRPSDYFAGWLAWVPVCMSTFACALMALLALLANSIALRVADAEWTVSTRLILALFVVAALVINGIELVSIRWIALSTRTLLSSNVQAARGADNFRRAFGIGVALQMWWPSSGYLLMAALSVLTTPGLLIGPFSPIAARCICLVFHFWRVGHSLVCFEGDSAERSPAGGIRSGSSGQSRRASHKRRGFVYRSVEEGRAWVVPS
ncbi:MAG TPA: hypothetical protein VF792_06595 [Ktedonobacterales bacterium]